MVDARTIDIYDKKIPIRKYGCKNIKGKEPIYIKTPRINLFIQVNNQCQANCDFCIYHNCENKQFNVKKLGNIIKYLSFRDDLDIGKLNFTGGEPLISFSNFEDIIQEVIKNLNFEKKPEVTLNTNGINLEKVLPYEDFLDSIGLSRHHYDDKKNTQIFNTSWVPTSREIGEFNEKLTKKEILQLRCNLIKGEIDSFKEVQNYMDWAISLGINDCGFVTLAPNNDFCKSHQVDFSKLIEKNDSIIQVNGWQRLEENLDKPYCECANYVYSNRDGNLCKFYSRLFCRNDCKDGILVYDGIFLRYGFNGEIIF